MEIQTITLNGKEYKVRIGLAASLCWEKTTGKKISQLTDNLEDVLLMFYCCLKTSNKIDFSFNKFVDMLDNDIEALDKFNKVVESSNNIRKVGTTKKK